MKPFGQHRRSSTRYPLELNLRYRVLDGLRTASRGSGTSKDISRTGVRFATPREIPVGSRVELTADWPARFGGIYPLELFMQGTVRRYENGEVAVELANWNFRLGPAKHGTRIMVDLAQGHVQHRGQIEGAF